MYFGWIKNEFINNKKYDVCYIVNRNIFSYVCRYFSYRLYLDRYKLEYFILFWILVFIKICF